jgi:hypothetical protein
MTYRFSVGRHFPLLAKRGLSYRNFYKISRVERITGAGKATGNYFGRILLYIFSVVSEGTRSRLAARIRRHRWYILTASVP